MIDQPNPTNDITLPESIVESETVKVNWYSRYIVQPILIAILVTAIGAAFLSLIAIDSPNPWHIIIFPVFIMAIEGIFTAIWMSHPEQRLLNKPLYRGAEVLLVALFMRLFTWLLLGNWPEAAAIIDYLRTPSLIFGDPFFILSLFVVLATWSWAISITTGFQKMALDPSELSFYDLPVRDRPKAERPNTPFRTLQFEQFGRQWLIGAGLMAFFAAISTVDYTNLDSSNWRTVGRLALAPGILPAMLCYFGAGFALISQGRLAIMNARWLFGDAEKTVAVERGWLRQTGWVVLIVGGIAAFLPLGSTLFISQILQAIIGLAVQIVAFLIFLFALIVSFFFPDIERTETEVEEFVPEPFVVPEVVAGPPPAEPGFPIIGTLFWIIAIGITIMALVFFLKDRGIKLPSMNWGKIKQAVVDWWQSLWRIVVEQAQDLRDAVLTRLVREDIETDKNQPWRFIRLNSLSPQQKLRYFYLSTVQRTESGTLAKKGSDTPLEYAADLKKQLPESAEAIDAVTAGFLQARYANQAITTADVEQVEPRWKALRKAIKSAKGAT
ncbi:MAG: DUF4129 domain-containing protein [Anaerolineae bacterium]